MERLKKPTTIAALTWLKDRYVSMKVPESRAMVEKAIEELGYRIPKKPDSTRMGHEKSATPKREIYKKERGIVMI